MRLGSFDIAVFRHHPHSPYLCERPLEPSRSIEQTQPDFVIAPVNVVPFRDAALFWVNYYDHVIYRKIDERRAFDSTKKYLRGKITGGFQLWENDY